MAEYNSGFLTKNGTDVLDTFVPKSYVIENSPSTGVFSPKSSLYYIGQLPNHLGYNVHAQITGINPSVLEQPPYKTWKNLVTGTSRTYALATDGTLWAWGTNLSGDLAQGDTATRSSPTQIGSDNNWKYLFKAPETNGHALAIKTDGTLWAWGSNSWSNLGLGDSVHRSSPVQVGSLTDWKAVASGAAVVAVKTNGTLWTWGFNVEGNLGLGDTVQRSSPVQVGSGTDWKDVSIYGNVPLALKNDNTLWAIGGGAANITPWGMGTGATSLYNSPVQLGSLTNWLPTNLSEPCADQEYHTLTIKQDGTMWTWGTNGYYTLGQGDAFTKYSSPVQLGALTNWKYVSPTKYSTLAIKTDGTLWAWGQNIDGQLGLGDTLSRSSPVQVGSDTNWKFATTASYNTIAIKTDGTLWTWGNQCLLGNVVKRSSPVQVGSDTNWKTGSLYGTVYLLKTDGTLWGAGSNTRYELSTGNTTFQSSPVQIGSDTDWNVIFCGSGYGMAIKTNGTLWGWGYNGHGNLGNQNTVDVSSKIQIGTLTDWKQLAGHNDAGGYPSSYAIKTDGTLWAWGNNRYGQLAVGDFNSRSSPVQVGSGTNWAYVDSNFAIKTDGTAWVWGINQDGKLGMLSPTPMLISSPVQVGTDKWKVIPKRGSLSAMGIKIDGTLWGWGQNTYGHLGFAANSYGTSSPVQIGTDSDWAQFSLSDSNAHLLKTNGTLWLTGIASAFSNTLMYSSPMQIGSISTDWKKLIYTSAQFSILLK